MRGNAALGIRAGEDPATYGGVVQADSHDPGEGEARAHIREKQVRGLPPPRMGQVGQRMMGHDGCASSAALGIRAGEDPADYKLDCTRKGYAASVWQQSCRRMRSHGAKRLAMTYKEYGRAGCGTLHGGHSRVSQVRFLPRPPRNKTSRRE